MLCQVSEQSNEFEHGQWTYDESFFQKYPKYAVGRFGQKGRINYGAFGVHLSIIKLKLNYFKKQYSSSSFHLPKVIIQV